jgi:(p)ppGpp synthase/HD superfamily hydrolase
VHQELVKVFRIREVVMPDPNDIVFQAAAFAARAHKDQKRKDNETPYFIHPVRVCLVVRQLFGFDDPKMLAAALLHDTIEDTTTDYDDLLEAFGPDVAKWVAALSKDSRLPNAEREEAYCKVLASSDWQVKVIKMADQYDNMGDCAYLDAKGRKKTARKVRTYLDAVGDGLPPEGKKALELVEARLAKLESKNSK